MQAKDYALVGMRKLSLNLYRERIVLALRVGDKVTTERGCIMDHEAFRSVAKLIDAGEYDAYLQPRKR